MVLPEYYLLFARIWLHEISQGGGGAHCTPMGTCFYMFEKIRFSKCTNKVRWLDHQLTHLQFILTVQEMFRTTYSLQWHSWACPFCCVVSHTFPAIYGPSCCSSISCIFKRVLSFADPLFLTHFFPFTLYMGLFDETDSVIGYFASEYSLAI